MSNNLIKIFDNIGFNCVIKNSIFIPGNTLKSFNRLTLHHVGYHIPYLCRNIQQNLYETGVGLVKYDNNGNIVVERINIVQSSNNQSAVEFPDNNNEFYIFANQSVFDKLVYNTIILDKNTKIDPVSALYLVDTSDSDIFVELPPVILGLILEFKLISNNNYLTIRSASGNIISVLSANKSYIRLTADNNNWIILNEEITTQMGMQSVSSDTTFSALSDPQGSSYSLQYKIDGTTFGGSNTYWEPNNQQLLLGADNTNSAKNILSTSGNYTTVFNNTKDGSDFIVYGSGTPDKNLFFSYDGRVGVNIPSGSRPSTLFHVVNTVCQEGIRLENRTSCHPANITLYHKPSTTIDNNSTVAQLKLAAKNSNGNQTNYARIEARAVNTSAGSEKGGLDIILVSGVTGVKVIESSTDLTTIGYTNNRIQITNNGSLNLSNGNSQINIGSQAITLSSNSISTTGTITATNLLATNIEATTFKNTNITPSSLLMIDTSGRIANSPISINNLGSINLPIPSNKLLSINNNGSVTGIYSLDDYFLTEQDITWSKFAKKSASICLKQITFSDIVDIEEFSIGDQILISSTAGNFYRRVVSLDIVNSIITGLVVDQNVTQTSTVNVQVYSITKGGYLTIQSKVDDGIISDASSVRISTRPQTDTVFNQNQHDINFAIYGLSDEPGLFIKSNSGRLSVPSGIYNSFASTRNDIFSIIVNNSGSGISSAYSSANYDYDISRNLFSGILSNVGTNGMPSFYGTYDQNGNAAEWVEQPGTFESKDRDEFVAGGSYATTVDPAIGSSGLKAVELFVRASGYEDVGFRVASSYGLIDNIYVSASTGLNIHFVSIENPKNVPDSSITYFKQPSGIVPRYISLIDRNLGSVDNNYRLGKYEITNEQYCRFLNIVAQVNDRGLYDSRMATTDVGGILRTFTGFYEYTVKPNMENKPVVFVNYLSVIRFINWLHNGASQVIAENDIDYNLDTGAYTIISIGTNSYNIIKSSYRKYWLPDLNEWHKGAYYRPIDASTGQGTTTVSVRRNEPQVIASGVDKVTGQPAQEFANLSVSGWLYVDHLIVGDGTIRSSKEFLNLIEPTTTNTNTQTTNQSTSTNNYNNQWNNVNAIVTKSYVSCVASSGCDFNAKPLRLDDDTVTLCNDAESILLKNIPWWCDSNNNGPGWFIKTRES